MFTRNPSRRILLLLTLSFALLPLCNCNEEKVCEPETLKTAECGLSPATLDFGTVAVGTSVDAHFAVQNAGSDTLVCDLTSESSSFILVSGAGESSIAPGDTLLATVRFTPLSEILYTGSIYTGTDLCGDVLCFGLGHMPSTCQVLPSTLNFGAVEVHDYAEAMFTIQNTGGSLLQGTINETCMPFAALSGDFSLGAGDLMRVGVRYEPVALGTHSCTIELGDCFVDCIGQAQVTWNGHTWRRQESGTSRNLYSVWGISDSDVYAVGDAGTILHYDGLDWNPMVSPIMADLRGIFGGAANHVYAVGYQDLSSPPWSLAIALFSDGGGWTDVTPDVGDVGTRKLYDVWVFGQSMVAVGMHGYVLHYDGAAWSDTALTSVTPGLDAVWGFSATDVFAAGDNDKLFHFDGSTWTWVHTSLGWYHSMWGASPNDLFLSGRPGQVVHYDGAQYTPMSSGANSRIRSLYGTSGTDIFGAGDDGTVIHYDGSQWEPIDIGEVPHLQDVWVSPSGSAFVVGLNGTILYYDVSSTP